MEGFRDLLAIQVDLPKLESPGDDLLTEAIRNPGLFDSQLYLFETTGILVSLLSKLPAEQVTVLLSAITPLLDVMSANLSSSKGDKEVIAILRIHHSIMALGNIAKGFPDHPSPAPAEYLFAPLEVFRRVSREILVALEAMNAFKDIRDAVGLSLKFL